ncbi:nitrite reductase large subunit NirB [Paenibacillus hexagrammi]|uniref:Nitrite reductase large subunit NirB n=1 Tax=Paenibacillus hexagrammi TaxID=2908839 RepID=A0ABY3SGW3_9BACL|nr:nitrite reductase large subunit NirB [Paenibacillus sp. YPD9-1]UJF32974.1 nitrite reductase large subunit NirB [Paenibacillus sp. YPD9-1]
MGKQRLVVIGNGMAGVRCVEEILAHGRDRFDIQIFGGEPHPNYNRIMLSKVLQGDTTVADITINDWQWYRDNGITLHAGDPVIHLDTARRLVVSEQGRTVPYDKLILATGSLPFMLPLPGADKSGVTAFRDIRDCNKMVEASKEYRKAVVIGGGLLGLEAARGLLNLGMDVHVVHIHHYLMERQLDFTAAGMLRKELESQGMKFLLEKHTERIIGKKRVEGLQFKDGSKVEADLVVMAVGVRPNIQLAQDSWIETNRAIVVNDYMETNVPDVYAVGECAEHRGMVYGLVAPLYEQGKVLAKRICGLETEGYAGSTLYSQLKVSGVEVFSAGEIRDSEVSTSLQIYDGIRNTYKKVFVRDNKIVGAVLFGDSSEGNQLLGYIKQQADVSVLDEGKAGSAGGGADEAYAESLPLTATVCSCNGVSKGAILDAVREGGCATVEDIRACTRASGTCGGCKPLVTAMLQLALRSKDAPPPAKLTVCGCTPHSHEELRAAVRSAAFASAREAMDALGWGTPDGCGICRPAVRYYVGLAQSAAGRRQGEAAVQLPAASLLANGTYAVRPRMYGGVTSAEQLRRIAGAIEKYAIPVAKLTGGGYLELLGIDAAVAAAVSAEVGLPGVAAAGGTGAGAPAGYAASTSAVEAVAAAAVNGNIDAGVAAGSTTNRNSRLVADVGATANSNSGLVADVGDTANSNSRLVADVGATANRNSGAVADVGATANRNSGAVADVGSTANSNAGVAANATHALGTPIEAASVELPYWLSSPLSASYGRTVGTVATCAGLGYDHGAQRDSVGLGARLERRLEQLPMPAAVSVAVSASPLHRAGSLAKDLGLVGAPAGWEIYVGGSSGIKIRQGELLCTEPSDEEALDVASAYLQWYREEADYGETTAQWTERKGITGIREGLFDLHFRAELMTRMKVKLKSEEGAPVRGVGLSHDACQLHESANTQRIAAWSR